jgi:hypothetical protein
MSEVWGDEECDECGEFHDCATFEGPGGSIDLCRDCLSEAIAQIDRYKAAQ